MTDKPRVIVPEEDTSSHKRLLETPTLHDKDIRQLVEQQVKDALAQA